MGRVLVADYENKKDQAGLTRDSQETTLIWYPAKQFIYVLQFLQLVPTAISSTYCKFRHVEYHLKFDIPGKAVISNEGLRYTVLEFLVEIC
jgi:hypothetical protein